ncbi:MAG: hypothetical protein QM730_04010 [Anaerolineales bacterium]
MTTLPTQSESLSRFNKFAWLVCTYGAGLLLSAILSISNLITGRSSLSGSIVDGMIISILTCGTYLLFPYWLYQRQVVQGIKLSVGWWVVMAIYTGILGGIVILWLFDVLRQIMKLIMKPSGSEQIDFIYNGK